MRKEEKHSEPFWQGPVSLSSAAPLLLLSPLLLPLLSVSLETEAEQVSLWEVNASLENLWRTCT